MFKKSGFYVAGGGKVFHPGHPLNNDFPASWDVYYKPNGDDGGCRQNETIYSNVCPSAEPESAFYDYQLASLAVAQFKAAKNMSRPFFVAAGLRRPHRVWHVPKKYYDLYPNNGTDPTDIKLALHKTGPTGMPELAYIDNAWPSFRYDQNAPIPDRIAALGRWGYYAAVSFTDANLGLMLDALDELDLAKETVVALVGDHGWELGEHGEWCKRTNWEVGVRIPYMIRSPRHPETYGRQSAHFAEALDLYRTLAGLAGLPGSAVERGVEGDDLTPVFANASAVIKTAAYSQMARCPAAGTLGPESACNAVKLTNIKYMGISVRTELWRYTGWFGFNGTANRVVWGDLQGAMTSTSFCSVSPRSARFRQCCYHRACDLRCAARHWALIGLLSAVLCPESGAQVMSSTRTTATTARTLMPSRTRTWRTIQRTPPSKPSCSRCSRPGGNGGTSNLPSKALDVNIK